ncbi:MAG: glycosyltransferase family 9 protein [Planctomycetaceae bacterium]|nr:glycosyltransferase family 9 protein [Planctomycetaceae bacterium]
MPANRYLIVRLSAIGDTVLTLPLAAALKRVNPNSFVGWVVEKPSAPLVENNPAVDWTYVLPRGWLKSPRTVMAVRQALRAQRFDIAFDVQGLTKSAAAAWLSGAKTRVGFARSRQAREISPWLHTVHVPLAHTHVVDFTLSLLAGAGLPLPEQVEFPVPPPSPEERGRVDAAVGADKTVLFGPWGSIEAKLWPLERYGQLAAAIHRETGMRSLMLGHGENERSRAAEVAGAFTIVLDLAPELSLTGVAHLARRSRLFVGCDSFPLHTATAVGCPAIGLFGITDPERVKPYRPPGRAVYETLHLTSSLRDLKHEGANYMLDLTVDKVFKACMDVLREAAC